MTEVPELADVKERIARQYEQDGLLESLMGFALLIGGLSLASHGGSSYLGIFPVFFVIFAKAWRRKITYPRLGYAGFLEQERRQRKTRVLITMLMVVAALALGILIYLALAGKMGDMEFLSGPSGKLIFGAAIAIIIATVAAVRKATHLYYFAVLVNLLVIGAYMLNISGGYALALTGLLLLILGVVRLILFLRANPKLEDEAHANG